MKRSAKRAATKAPAAPRDLTRERDDEIIPAAREILLALASKADLMIGSSSTITAEKAAVYYQKIYVEVMIPILIARNLRLKDLPYLFQVLNQPVQLLNDVTTSSFEMNRDLADAKKYGLDHIDNLRVNDIDAALKEGTGNDNASE